MAQASLQEQPSETLIELFFDSDSSEERDALFEAVAHRQEVAVGIFLQAVLAHDEDPFLRISAARVVLDTEGPNAPIAKQAKDLLIAQLGQSDDELLFEEALDALLDHPTPDLFDRLEAIVKDDQQDITQRKLAQVAMARLDEARTLEACRTLVQDGQPLSAYPLDLIGVMVSLMVQSKSDADGAAIRQAAHYLAGPARIVEGSAHEGDDYDHDDEEASRRQALGDMLAEALWLVSAPPEEGQDA